MIASRGKMGHSLARSLAHSKSTMGWMHLGGKWVTRLLIHLLALSLACLLAHSHHSLTRLLARSLVCLFAHLLMGKCNCMSQPHASMDNIMDNIIDNIIDSMEENCFLPFILHHRIQGGEKFCTFGIETSDSPIFPPLYQWIHICMNIDDNIDDNFAIYWHGSMEVWKKTAFLLFYQTTGSKVARNFVHLE